MIIKITKIIVILMTTILVANAQFFVEGGVGFSYQDMDIGIMNMPGDFIDAEYQLGFTPVVGYQLNDNIAVGAKALFNKRNTIRHAQDDLGNPIKNEWSEFMWNMGIISRNKMYGIGKLSFLIESYVYIGGSNRNSKGNSPNSLTRSNFGLAAVPLVSYDLNDKFSLIAQLSFMGVWIERQTEIRSPSGLKLKQNIYRFGGQSTILANLSSIQLGFIYKF